MWRAIVKNGRLAMGSVTKKAYLEWLATHEGKQVLISPVVKKRSDSQNAYYWVYLAVIERETWNNAADLHEYFKRQLLPPVIKTIMGKEVRLPRSTRTLNKSEFTEYLDKIAALTNVALPDREAAGYIKN